MRLAVISAIFCSAVRLCAAPAVWEERPVPHGQVHRHTYPSASLQQERPMRVYTPPGYETAADRAYPLLVLAHGRGDNESAWLEKAGAHWTFDNLIAEGKSVPAVVLMINGHPEVKAPDGTDFRAAVLTAFQRDLLEDAIPWAEKQYRLLPGPANRAIAGLSMGGMQAVTTALTYPDKFAWVASFSGAHAPDAGRYRDFLTDPARLNQAFRLFWMSCGTEDEILARNLPHIALFNEKKFHHEWHLTAGAHDWVLWRANLAELAPRLFR